MLKILILTKMLNSNYREFFLLIRIYNAPFCRRPHDLEPILKYKYKVSSLYEIKSYLDYPVTSSGLDGLFAVWKKLGIMIKEKEGFWFNGERIEEYLKENYHILIKEFKQVYGIL